MNFKDLRLREILVIIFIVLGLGAFVFEKNFKPTLIEVVSTGEGFNGDIELKVLAYKKSNGDIRISKITVDHGDTDAVAAPAISKMTETILSTQKFDIEGVAGATYTSEGFIEALGDAIIQIKNK